MILNAVAAGEGPPVVLLHGLFGSTQSFATLQRRLCASNRVVALDLRNHGASPHAPGMDYPTMAADVAETLALQVALPCALIGHSMGGKVAMRLALDRPECVARLLVSDIAPVSYQAGFRGYAEAMAALDLTPPLTRAAAGSALATAVPDRAVRDFLLQNLRLGAQPSWRLGLADIAAGLPAIEDWPGTEAVYPGPTLFVAGANSHYIRSAHRPVIRERFPAARFVTVKNAGHWIHADNPAAFLAVIEAFLATK
jgi:pimeloyl-ACP methyl ester carboxylesterase